MAEDEENLSRSGALQNAGVMLAADERVELVESREALRSSEARYRSVVEGAPHGIIIQTDGHIVYANCAMARLFGYASSDDLLGLNPFDDLIFSADLDVFRTRTAEVYAGGQVQPTPPWRARRGDSQTVWISSTAHISQWQGRPAVTSFYVDITERLVAELAARENEARYRSALTAGRMGAWETDLVGGTRTWSEEGMALFGLSLADGRGTVGGDADEYASAIHPDDRFLVAHLYEQADHIDSFPAEYRIVRPDGVVLWLSGRGQVVTRMADGTAHRLISIMADVTERKAAEEQIQLLSREVTHRAKNMLAVVQSIANQTARTAGTLAEFQLRFRDRLQGLASSFDILVRENWRGALLTDLVRQHLAPFVDTLSPRVIVSGPEIVVSADAAQTLGLALHELATNAVKYGALSVPTGLIKISWAFDRVESTGRKLNMTWMEMSGPNVAPPARKGFGHIVLHQMLEASLHAEVVMEFAVEGLVWSALIPAETLEPRIGRPSLNGGPPFAADEHAV